MRRYVLGSILILAPMARVVAAIQPSTASPDRAIVISRLATLLREKYAFAEIGEKTARALERRIQEGAYLKVRNDSEFAQAVTQDLQRTSNDRHLVVQWLPSLATSEKTVEKERDDPDQSPRNNFGFESVIRLAGNVGYLKLRSFAAPAVGGDTAIAAMRFLANTDALIVDLRDNGGGSGELITLIASYFFESRTHLNDRELREGQRVEQFWTSEFAVGSKMAQIPIYILTSRRTFSAAEEFAYDLQALRRATIVGERTAGGANPGDFIALGGPFRVFLPLGRSVNPITRKNWEGSGVVPDIAIDAEVARDVAYAEALKKLAASATETQQLAQIDWAQTAVEARLHSWSLSESEAERFVGRYGPRSVTRNGTTLSIRYQDLPPTRMIPLASATFGLEGEDSFRIRFVIDSAGQASKLIGMTENETAYESERSRQ